MLRQPDQAHIVFLFSDTGGGHRSAASAIVEALDLEFSGQFTCEMIDIFRQYAPPPLHMAPEMYPPLARLPDMWEFGFKVSDGARRTRIFYHAIWPYVRTGVNRLVRENPADLIVSVHPLVNAPVLRALGIRSRREIGEEKYALKLLRGDFDHTPNPLSAEQLLKLVRK